MTIERQEEFLGALISKIEADARLQAAWLEGSWGRGAADRYSDLDIHLLVTEAGLEEFRAEARAWLESVKPLVLYNLMFGGKMINALTEDGLRIDIWLRLENPTTVYADRAQVLYAQAGVLQVLDAAPSTDPAAVADGLARTTREFWRCYSLLPSVIGRNELIISFVGLGIETNLINDLLIAGYGVDRPSGMKHLNHYLPGTTRAEIEAVLAQVELSPASLLRAHMGLADLVRRHGPVIAQRHGYPYPAALERAALAYVREEVEFLKIPH